MTVSVDSGNIASDENHLITEALFHYEENIILQDDTSLGETLTYDKANEYLDFRLRFKSSSLDGHNFKMMWKIVKKLIGLKVSFAKRNNYLNLVMKNQD